MCINVNNNDIMDIDYIVYDRRIIEFKRWNGVVFCKMLGVSERKYGLVNLFDIKCCKYVDINCVVNVRDRIMKEWLWIF